MEPDKGKNPVAGMAMVAVMNVAEDITGLLPDELLGFLREGGKLADAQGQKLYLIGGIVRDLLLGKTNYDIDCMVEGDAVALARKLSNTHGGELIVHRRFRTANLFWHGWSLDFATARSESYPYPGALPEVTPSRVTDDFSRRDFTINTMAVSLSSGNFGDLLDPYNGREDLEKGLLRILHDRSFSDDATRIWRAIRYEQRFDFTIEPKTLELLKQDVVMLETISRDRLKNEIDLVLREARPEKALQRAYELGALTMAHPALLADEWLNRRFHELRHRVSPELPTGDLYLALMTWRMTGPEMKELMERLGVTSATARILRDTARLREHMGQLENPRITNSAVYHLLEPYSPETLLVVTVAIDSEKIRDTIRLYLEHLRHIKPAMNGNDIIEMGVPAGPRVREMLDRLLDARLDGKVGSSEEEENRVRGWLKNSPAH